MHRTSNAFSVLQATAAIASLAILLWSIGLPSIRFAEAAAITNYSDTLSTAEPSVDANHTITFTTPTGIANGETIVLDFSDGSFDPTSVDFSDIDVQDDATDLSVATDCTGSEQTSAAFSGTTLTITFCTGDGASIGAGGTTTIEIGTNATFGSTGDQAINNPGTPGSYQIPVTAGSADTGETRVAIVDNVLVTASVDTVFTFTVTGVGPGQTVNGTTTGASTTATLIPLGELQANTASTAAQDLTVVTNAANGFSVTVTADGQLTAGGADIDGFSNGTYVTSPTAWTPPTGVLGSENTYGHWGLTSDDTDIFAATQTYVSASTSPVTIYTHDGPTDGTTTGEGTTRVGYTVEVSSLQEAATDYQAVLTYVATPVF